MVDHRIHKHKKKKKKKRGLKDDLIQSFHVTYLILQPREVTQLS